LSQIAAKQGRKAKDVAPALGKGVRTRLHARLAERGLLHEETAKILGIFSSHRWPSSDSWREDSVRALLADALRTGSTDDALVSALSAWRSATRPAM
jgi:Golgi phosphoprotein 3 (GPP34)